MTASYLTTSEQQELDNLENLIAAGTILSYQQKGRLKELQDVADSQDDDDEEDWSRGGRDKYADY